jgi:hypothetical protein
VVVDQEGSQGRVGLLIGLIVVIGAIGVLVALRLRGSTR